MNIELLKEVVIKRDEIIEFLKDLIKIPSLSTQEGDLAEAIASKMQELNYDKVKVDEVGNVIGIIRGTESRPSLLYNGHMDTVPVGTMKDPFSAQTMDGKIFGTDGEVIYGRGACDMKGALAAMVFAGGILKEKEIKLKGDLIVNGVVMEELCESFGSSYVAEKYRPDVVVVGEATNLDVTVGHRGIIYLEVITKGKSCHASAPERGVNALYKMTEIIRKIQTIIPYLPSHPFLGKTTMSVNTISVVPGALNVVPDGCQITVDIRNIPELDSNQLIRLFMDAIDELKKHDPELEAEVRLIEKEETSYTGYKKKVFKILPPFYTDPSNPRIEAAVRIISYAQGRPPKVKPWVFATDSAAFASLGAVTFGFGPGEEVFAHSVQDHIRIEDLITAAKVYTMLPTELCK